MPILSKAMKEHLEGFFWLCKLPNGLSFLRQPKARDLLMQYLSKPEAFWKGSSLRQAEKVRRVLLAFSQGGLEGVNSIADTLLNKVREAKTRHHRPFFVMGAGCSGSTWLGAMLGDFPGYCYGREIYLPNAISYLYRRFRNQEMIDLIWSIMLLPAWGFNFPTDDLDHEFVNSGRSMGDYDIYREIWPDGRFIFLVRDPRDQLLSATYRKPSYRKVISPGASDLEYLSRNAKKLMKTYRFYLRARSSEVHVVRYELLRDSTIVELKKISERFCLNLPSEVVAKVSFEHNADNIRAGLVPHKGNLDEGGVSKNWRETITDEERRTLKLIIQPMLEALDYEQNSHW